MVWVTNGTVEMFRMMQEMHSDIFIGEPQPTEKYSIEKLKKLKYIGVYRHV